MPVKVSVEEFCRQLGLEILSGTSAEIEFSTDEINRPGLQFTGYYEDFLAKRVQLIGNAEMHYLFDLPQDRLLEAMRRFMSFKMPCIVCARGQRPPAIMLECAQEHNIPVFLSQRKTGEINHAISEFLERQLAPRILLHGVLMDVSGIGTLLMGDSGIGKSETALEMIKNGHRLVADDVVEITRLSESLVGCSPKLTQNLMEVRGIGLVNVRYMYGVGAVMMQKQIDLVLKLRLWDEKIEYDRMRMGERTTDILGIQVPCTELPVSPGRNIAAIVEVAARNFRLKRMGYDIAADFEKLVEADMNRK